MKKKPKTVFD